MSPPTVLRDQFCKAMHGVTVAPAVRSQARKNASRCTLDAHREAVSTEFSFSSGGKCLTELSSSTTMAFVIYYFYQSRGSCRGSLKIRSQPDIAGRETFRICKFSAIWTPPPQFCHFRVTSSNCRRKLPSLGPHMVGLIPRISIVTVKVVPVVAWVVGPGQFT
jgi:hypothetical protein